MLLHRYRKRTGLFAGAALVAVGLLILGCFIWQVEIQGLQTIPEEEVRAALTELGVRRGALRRDIDAREVERMLMLRLDKAAWVAVKEPSSGTGWPASRQSRFPMGPMT